jgi:xylan 1,4-beta-xylosidase
VAHASSDESPGPDFAATQARADWEQRIYRRLTDTSSADATQALPAPPGLRASSGAGHVRLDWEPVAGAAGYLFERRAPDGHTTLLQHGGSDVPAVPYGPFADTGLETGADCRYRIAAVRGAEYPAWNWSDWVAATVGDGPPKPLVLAVDAAREIGEVQRVWELVGSERLTQLRFGDDGNGNDIGPQFADALQIATDDLGVTRVRAHAILHDDNHVVTRAVDGHLVFDFDAIDALYDEILTIGLQPVVELSFMPAAIARDPSQTVFAYRGIISPPADWADWYTVVHALAAHLVERYGIDEVACWGFEVWNEPNLEVFWSGSKDDYLRLYDEAATAVKRVDGRLLVGGPSTAAEEWIDDLAAHCEQSGLPLDFVSSHTYGNVPLDARPALQRHGFAGVPIWWTEWGVGSTHYGPIHDGVIGAPFALTGFHDVQGRMQALAYWVISDHFEELGRPPRLFHNGFGLLTVGNLRKPRYWAVHLAAHQGDHTLASELAGDGADVLVRNWATKHDDGTVDVLVWNTAINGALMDGDDRLDRDVEITVTGLDDGGYDVALARIDRHHSNILDGYPDDIAWPDDHLWQALRARDRLHEEDHGVIEVGQRATQFEIALPMPGVARIRLTPARARTDAARDGKGDS